MDRYYQVLHTAVATHGGTVVKLLGDGVMAAFGVPRVAEDDAIRAVRAAVAMQQAFGALARDQTGGLSTVGLRVAVNTGEVVVSADHSDVVGDPVNVAAHLQQQAQDGDVLVGEATRRLVGELVTLAPVGALTFKGRAEAVAAFRVVSLERPAGAPATAFVGREAELGRLRAVYDTAIAARCARLAVVLGSPGLGKSRLLAEFTRHLGDGATVLTAQCNPTGGATFAPIAEALRAFLHLDASASADTLRAALEAGIPGDDAERGRIAGGIAALLAGTPASPEETFFVVRRLLTGLATAQPVVLAIDDLQWAEPLLLDLTEHLVQWSTGVPLLVLVAARPELRDLRSSLAAPGGLVAEVVTLAGLDAGAATRLAANVIGAGELPAAVAGRVLATSEGNPLFVGELVRMLVQDGALKREGDRWTVGVELATLEMPPTIHALLAGRIERLRPEDRVVLERAAVVGRQFSRTAVAHLLPREVTDLDARLESLRRSELIEPDTGWFLGEPVLRFHHVLIRDAAYRRLLKGTRAELHGRFADWLETRVGEAVEHDETIGWHLEQAHRHLRELGPIDSAGRVVGERAARYLAAAGRRALVRDDVPLAASLLGRALDRLDAADAGRAELALDWCEALLAAGDVGPAVAAIDELGRFIDASDRLRAWHTCFAGQRAALTDPQALHATADAVAAAADTLASLGDAAGEAKAYSVHALALARLGKIGACEAALDRALAAARRAHDRRRANAVLAGAPLAALWGPSAVTRASGRCLDVVRVLRITQGAPAVEAVALRCQAVLEALRGRTEAARRMIGSSRHLVEELGITQRLLEADVFAGLIELLEGNAVAAEISLRTAYDGLRQHGLGIDAAQAAALLGRALLAQGRAADAEALSHESEALAGDDLKAAIAWRGVRAEALAQRGESVAAVDLARAAVDIAAATDALLDHADARLALAAALRAAGRHDHADAEEARAIELWEAKGATLLAERARRDGGRVTRMERAPDDGAAPAHHMRRQVRANAATANAARLDAAVAARDVDACGAIFADDSQTLHHPTGATYDRRGALAWVCSVFKAEDVTFANEPLATLGDSLALCRLRVSASGVSAGRFDVGPYESEQIALIEVDAYGQRQRAEFFADDHLGAAVIRLYERYAELLPDGPARARAAATARSVAVLLGPVDDPDRYAEFLAPAIEFVDHRRLVSLGSAHGAEALLQGFRIRHSLVDNVVGRVDELLYLQSDAILIRWTISGTDRASGGAYEILYRLLWTFGADGLATRIEWFDHDDEALTRFDELTAEPTRPATASSKVAKKRERRVRPNAATANAARVDAAFAARDGDGIGAVFADDAETVHHPTGTTYDRQGALVRFRSHLRAEDATIAHEPLATLGDSLALCRMSWSASGASGRTFDVGPYEGAQIALIEIDARGQRRRSEFFADDRLNDAVVRLYERYADLLPDGPARARAAATARSVAVVLVGPFDPDRFATAQSPAVEVVDHRILGMGSVRGAGTLLRVNRSLFELAYDITLSVDDVLALQPDALLVRQATAGTDRASGGAFEQVRLLLRVFGDDGLQTRIENFDADRLDEALARFDELTGAAPPRFEAAASRAAAKRERRVRPNAATANAARIDAAFAARDADVFPSLLAEESEVIEHTTGATYGREGSLRGWRAMLNADDLTFRHEPIATLGDALALCHHSLSATGVASGALDVGAYESERVLLSEVDAQGRRRWLEMFAPDRLGDAVVRLYERYADLLPDGPARGRAAATARAVAALFGPLEIDRYAMAIAPTIEFVDHRPLGLPSGRGVGQQVQLLRSLLDLSSDIVMRTDEVLVLRSDALLVRWTNFGTMRVGGGAYERHFLMLWIFGADGLVARNEIFAADRDTEALARFDELTGELRLPRLAVVPSRTAEKRERRVQANAATVHVARLDAAIAARDPDRLPALFADESETVEHATGTTYSGRGDLNTWRYLLKAPDPACRNEPLATLGESLALCRTATSGSGFTGGKFDVGAYEMQHVALIEVDAHGRRRQTEVFEVDRLGDAVTRLYERYADLLPDGPARARAAATARSVAAMIEPFDVERIGAAVAPDVEFVDRQTPVSFGSVRSKDALLRGTQIATGFTEDDHLHVDDVLALQPDALLIRTTHSGIERAGGGAFDREFLRVGIFGRDGLVTHFEWFDSDRSAEALARFDELTAEPAATRSAAAPVRAAAKRVRANAATASLTRLDAAFQGRDVDEVAGLVADDVEITDHTLGVTFDRQGMLASWRMGLRARDPTLRHEPLATLGDSLALCRLSTSASALVDGRLDVGAHDREWIIVSEVDSRGRQRRRELYATGRLGDAVSRLYERQADLLPNGPARARAAATARSVAAMLGPFNPDRYAAAYAPAIESVDHRILGTWSARGADTMLNHWRSVVELADDIAMREDDLLELRSDALLTRRTHSGTARAGGGPYERQFLALLVFGTDGLVVRSELFDADRDAEALARFDELAMAPPPFANAAWRSIAESIRARERRDWDALVALYLPGYVFDDRRSLLRTRVEGDAALAHVRIMFEHVTRMSRQLLATRGDRLVLERCTFTSRARDGGPAEFEMLTVVEVDADGRRMATVSFDSDDVDAAHAELDERYTVGEAAVSGRVAAGMYGFIHAIAARDWEAILAVLSPDLVVSDHRLLGWETLRGPDTYIETLKSLVDLAPDVRLRNDHMRLADRAALFVNTWVGTREGGAFEAPRAVVFAFDALGHIRSMDFYDPEQLDQAAARFDAIGASAVGDPLAALARPNAATVAMDRVHAAFAARDASAMRAVCAPGARIEDRRRLALASGDTEWWIADMLGIAQATPDARPERQLVGTAGDRVDLERILWRGGPAGGRFEVEHLWLAEVDEVGRIVAAIAFGLDDWRAANREAWARWLAADASAAAVIGPIGAFLEALNDHNRARVRMALADDVVVHDRRRTGMGLIEGADAYVEAAAALWDLASDVQYDWPFRLQIERHGWLSVVRGFGTLREGGGTFESLFLTVTVVAGGRIIRIEMFEIDDVDAALARLAELRPDPTRIPPNAATRTSDRHQEALKAEDMDAFARLCAPTMVFDDRRRGVLLTGGRDLFIASSRHTARAIMVRSLLATAGDRLTLEHLRWTDPSGRDWEVENLSIHEVDAEGRTVAVVAFDLEDRRAASAEMLERYVRTEEARWIPASFLEFAGALNDHDLDRLRAAVPLDFVFDDHRRTGLGRLESAEDYLAAVAALFEQAPDVIIEQLYLIAEERHGSLSMTHRFGTVVDGGAFESVFVQLARYRGDRLVGLELFEPEDLDTARARFADLRPNPLRIPPNAACRARDRFDEALAARDWSTLRALASDDFVYEDRRRRALLTGDVELWIESLKFYSSTGLHRATELIATVGDRIALERSLWTGEADGVAVEVELLALREIDANGRHVAVILFDLDDRRAAFFEAQARFVAGEAAAVGGQAPIAAFGRSFDQHDWVGLRSCLADDLVLRDHRTQGLLDTFGADQWVESLRIQADLAPDLAGEKPQILAWNRHGRVDVIRVFGTMREDGPFENVFVGVFTTGDDRIRSYEIFDVDAADQALARFAELCADVPSASTSP
jgi:hypothetical protein